MILVSPEASPTADYQQSPIPKNTFVRASPPYCLDDEPIMIPGVDWLARPASIRQALAGSLSGDRVVELRGRVAVVTGGAVRIGRELCLALADAGADVCLHFGQSREAAEETATDIRARGSKAVTVQADLMHPSQAAETIITAAMRAFGHVDVLVNNASIFEPGYLGDTSDNHWDRHQRINLQAPLCLSQQFAALVPDSGNAAIINMADWRALRPQPGHLAYTLSKAGIVCLTQILAQELAPRIRVNAIAPGAILPPSGAEQQRFESLVPSIPLQRTGTPGDIVAAALYLLRNDFVTGEVLHVTGGQQLRVPAPGS